MPCKDRSRRKMVASVVGAHLAMAPTILMWIFGNLAPYLQSYTFSRLDAGQAIYIEWTLSFYVVFYAIGAGVTDALSKRMGHRHTELLSTVIFNAAIFSSSWTLPMSGIATAALLGVLGGASCGISCAISFSLIHRWMPQRSGLLIASATSVPNFMAVILNEVLTWYVNPRNLKPDLHVGRNVYFSQPELLDYVPRAVFLFGVITLSLQILGFLCIANPPGSVEGLKSDTEEYIDMKFSELINSNHSIESFSSEKTPHVSNSTENGSYVSHTPENGLHVSHTPENGLYVSHTPENRLHVSHKPENGLHVSHSPENGLHVSHTPENGLHVSHSPENRLHMSHTPENGLHEPHISNCWSTPHGEDTLCNGHKQAGACYYGAVEGVLEKDASTPTDGCGNNKCVDIWNMTDVSQSLTFGSVLKLGSFWTLWLTFASLDIGTVLLNTYYKQFGLLYIHNDHFMTLLGNANIFFSPIYRVAVGWFYDKAFLNAQDLCVMSLAAEVLLCIFWFFSAQMHKTVYLVVILGLGSVQSIAYGTPATLVAGLYGLEHFSLILGAVCSSVIFVSPLLFWGYPWILQTFDWFWLFAAHSFISLVILVEAIVVKFKQS